jgi:hypothetical protein
MIDNMIKLSNCQDGTEDFTKKSSWMLNYRKPKKFGCVALLLCKKLLIENGKLVATLLLKL